MGAAVKGLWAVQPLEFVRAVVFESDWFENADAQERMQKSQNLRGRVNGADTERVHLNAPITPDQCYTQGTINKRGFWSRL